MEEIEIIKNLINELSSQKHALSLSNKNMVELIALLKDRNKREREKGQGY
ncbi:MAG TPA: hypothetical protein VFV86_06825 [Nitrososphaeraceae archaeon]|nr:hypothetical protein [Nitrososphaeraceae archaeon]